MKTIVAQFSTYWFLEPRLTIFQDNIVFVYTQFQKELEFYICQHTYIFNPNYLFFSELFVILEIFILHFTCCCIFQDILVRARAQENDETYYLWAIRFFMQFNRHHKFSVDLVGCVRHWHCIHWITTKYNISFYLILEDLFNVRCYIFYHLYNTLGLHRSIKVCFYPPPVGEGGFYSRQDSVRRQASCVTFSCGRKNSKTTSQLFLKFYHHILSNMGMCKWFFRDATKIQNGLQRSTRKKFVGAKTLKPKFSNYSNFTITFHMIWRCAGDFFKVLLKFKMAATDQL